MRYRSGRSLSRTRWLALVILCVGDLMIVVDTTMQGIGAVVSAVAFSLIVVLFTEPRTVAAGV